MKIWKIAAIAALGLTAFAADNVAPTKAELEEMYNSVYRAFDAGKFPEALKQLNAIDARQDHHQVGMQLRNARRVDVDALALVLRPGVRPATGDYGADHDHRRCGDDNQPGQHDRWQRPRNGGAGSPAPIVTAMLAIETIRCSATTHGLRSVSTLIPPITA